MAWRPLFLYTIGISRARHWTHPDTNQIHWFNVYGAATNRELELLAEIEDLDIDDLLDASLSSREVLFRLNKHSNLIPPAGLERVEKRQERRANYVEPVCRICSVEGWQCDGRMTRHHFVPRWIMVELSDYQKYAPRSGCTMWICMGSHRFLHRRGNGASKSVAKYLDKGEKALAHHLIASLREERPKIYSLIASGDKTSYEWQLIRDWRRGLFDANGEGHKPFPRWQLRSNSL